jgi:tetratricopeptide (TPR) repeat protein
MKWILLLVIFSLGLGLQAQSWEDSLQKGKKLYKEGKYPQAYETLLEAQKIAPEGVDLSKDIGNAAYRSGDYKTAKSAFESAAASEDSDLNRADKWHNVGNSQMKEKDYAGAVESYKNALRADPSNDKTRYNLAEAKRRLKKQQEKKENQENDKNQDQNENQDESQDKKNQNQDSQNGDQNENKQNQQNQKNSQDSGDESSQANSEKLSNKKTDRLLEELLKKEMETKRKVRGVNSEGKNEEVKSGKKW